MEGMEDHLHQEWDHPLGGEAHPLGDLEDLHQDMVDQVN